MKKTFKFIASLVLVLSLVLGMGCTAFADSSVTYEGGAQDIVFLPGSGYTDTDLFEGFKNVMPGDEIEQKIQVRQSIFAYRPVRIYLRAITHDEVDNPLSPAVAASESVASMEDFLSQLGMTVHNGSKLIYSASPDELDGLRNNVLLGTFSRGESRTLTVTLYVPIELGNEYANRVGEVDWVFTAEEIDPGENPKTGDYSNIGLYCGLLLLSMLAIGFVFFYLRKKKKNS
ncbi:MAG: LPXTG cell wall anchor domain-containing protein [Oscillospiraceae bacterium]|nr:LPXTG cell wall anchor domain-containing protein [Oscillospiraceae bacterium]